MTLSQAINRMKWRFSECKSFSVNQIDVDAYNTLVEWINITQRKTWNSNSIAVKLYINEYLEQLKQYNCSVYDPIPPKEINKFLDKPINWHIQRIVDYSNSSEINRITEKLDTDKIKNLSKKEVNEYIQKIKESGETFNYAEVEFNLQQMITEALRLFS